MKEHSEAKQTDILSKRQKSQRLWISLSLLVLCLLQDLWLTPRSGVDPSWMIALNLALHKGFIFGKDIVFTYGPLGFLYTKLALFDLWPYLFMYYGVVLAFWAFIFYELVGTIDTWKGILLLALIVFIAPDKLAEHGLFFQLFFFVFYALQKQRFWALIPAVVLSVFMLYAKFSFGLVVNMLLYGSLLYMLLRQVFPLVKLLLLIVGHLALLVIVGALLPVSLFSYVGGGLYLISAFNDAMYFSDKISLLFLLFVGLMVLGYVSLFLRYGIRFFSTKHVLFYYGIVALMLFLLFKHGFVRADIHILIFFGFAPLYYYLFFSFSRRVFQKELASRVLWLFLLCSLFSLNTFPLIHYLTQNPKIKAYFKSRYPGINRSNFTSYSLAPSQDLGFVWNTYWESSSLAEPDTLDRILDPAWLKEIGDSPVDIFPYEISLLYFNNLNYRPRPVIQSYSAYDPYLDKLNAQFLSRKAAPEYLLFAANSIDKRYPLWDEGLTKQAILSNYDFLGQKKGLILLKKRKQARSQKLTLKRQETVHLGDTIWVEEPEGLEVIVPEIAYTALGKVLRFGYQPPPLFIELILADDTILQYRAIPTLLESGVIANKCIVSLDDYEDLFKNRGSGSRKVKAYRFVSPLAAGFQKSFNIRYYTF